MTARSLAAAIALAVGLGAAACERSAEPSPPAPPRCDVPLTVPDGFQAVGGLEDPHADRVGVRIDLADDEGRELHYFSGIHGEFGEGLADRGEVALRDGGRARLVGGDGTWVLAWVTPAPCTPTVVLGNGMDADEFRDLMRQAGALPQR